MPRYLNTRGRASIAIGICDRCHMKKAYSDLRQDGNIKGLWVCLDKSCFDRYDPYRLPPRQPERIDLRHPRPERRIGILTLYLTTEGGDPLLAENGDYLVIATQDDI